MGLAGKSKVAENWHTNTRVGTTDRPLGQITVEDGAIDSEECSQIGAHANNFGGSIDELLYGCNACLILGTGM